LKTSKLTNAKHSITNLMRDRVDEIDYLHKKALSVVQSKEEVQAVTRTAVGKLLVLLNKVYDPKTARL